MSERDRDSSATGREIGDELKRFRVGAGLLAADLADMLGCSASKISRMESGVRGYSELDVTMYLASCRASREDVVRMLDLVREQADGYRVRPHREKLPDELRSLIVAETLASSIIEFEPQIIPGILQIEDYARAVFRWYGQFDENGIADRVKARLKRVADLALDGGQSREWLAALASEYEQAKDDTR